MINTIKTFIEQHRNAEAFLEKLPNSVWSLFIDNEYSDAQHTIIDAALVDLLGKDKADWLYWYVDGVGEKFVLDNDKKIVFNTDEEFIMWLIWK